MSMQILDLTAEKVGDLLGRKVPDLYLTLAKHVVFGMSPESIAEIFDVSVEEIQEILNEREFEEVKLVVAELHAKVSIETDYSWDAAESIALKNLIGVLERDKDPDLNLKVAAIANKALRRNRIQRRPLEATAGSMIQLTLTKRLVNKLTDLSNGAIQVQESQAILLIKNPTFKQVDGILNVESEKDIEQQTDQEFTDEIAGILDNV